MNERSRDSNAFKGMSPASSNPLVSVIVPSYNQGQFIEETILSVLHQQYRPLEVIIVDGGSTDNTLEVLHKYDGHGEVHWISEPDRGQADAVNKGFVRAHGEIIGWLNSDDVYYGKDAISYMVGEFAEHPDADVIYGEAILITRDNTLLRVFLRPPYNRAREERRNMILQPAVFLRKSVTAAHRLDTNYIGLDYEYWLRLGANGCKFLHVRKVVAADRQYPERQSRAKKKQIDEQNIELKKRMGIQPPQGKAIYLLDWLAQAVCRLQGAWVVLSIIANKDHSQQLAFPARIDSPWKLLFRQIFHSSVHDL